MKRIFLLFLISALLLSLTSCGGVTLFSSVSSAKSDIYTDEEIDAAMDEVKDYFQRVWKGCVLLDISYRGDAVLETYNYKKYAEQNQADDVIVIHVDFYVPAFADVHGAETNSKYEDWSCVLLRYDGGDWEFFTGGYP